ncbi:endonuclease/exonuclease/phosphatase family protein [Labedella phragmitis]|uniref:Endonuclease/exonuclease/phosphatase family protein n=1 Tax=Labedella phragmitis TaxID=2498849 RepID=A0A444PYM1_9MICO|nr:endonuclease/exonuclease/phosphatase family protein [Labedella phragmitis]RWZ52995.1 endonuclease/exonuclease/phosphatase family protein [Labedella phragmitis]
MTESVLIGPVAAPELHVMTFNVRRPVAQLSSRSPDRWETRRPAVGALLRAERPSLLGVQEAMPEQAAFLRRALGGGYHSVGRGRKSDGTGEGCPIIFDAERLDLEAWTQQSLSDSPDTPGSTSWGSLVPRILVGAVFRDRETSSRFLAVNTHFDHLSRRSRLRSAERIRSLVAAQGLPAIVTGDLNTGEHTAPIRALLAPEDDDTPTLEDAWSVAGERLTAEWGTFPNYRAPRHDRKRIDWIATSPRIEVVRAGINTRRPAGVWASDHLPVQAVLRIPATEDTA